MKYRWDMAGTALLPRSRRAAVTFLLAVFPLLPGGSATRLESAELPVLTGVVEDPVGRVLEGVSIFLGSDLPDAVFRRAATDPEGRYEFSGILPGSYWLLAAKPGFQVRVLQVNMVLRRSLDFTLYPRTPAGGSVGEPGGGDPRKWVLRIPGGDILRSMEEPAALPGPGFDLPDEGERRGFARLASSPIRGEFLHLEVGQAPFSRGDGSELGSSGRQSRVRVDGGVGERMDWYFLGDLRRLTSFPAGDPSSAGREFQSGSLAMGMDFAPNREDDISVSFLYGKSLLRREEMFPDPFTPPAHQERKAWGYDAQWSREVDEASQFDVRLRYQKGRVFLPDPQGDLLARLLGGAVATLEHSRWDAGGQYRLDVADRHQLRMGMRTQVYRTGWEGGEEWFLVPSLAGEAGSEFTPPAGWDLDVFGEDHWKFSEPYRLIYSLTCSFSDPLRNERVLIPKVVFRHLLDNGTVWNAGLVFALNPGGGGEFPAGTRDPEPGTEMGYQLGLSRPLPQGFRVEMSATSHPAAGLPPAIEGREGFLTPAASRESDLFLAYRRVQKREFDLQVEKRFRHAVGRFGSTFGAAEGRLADRPEDSALLMPFHERSMRYIATRLQTVLERSETEVRIGYRKVSEEASPDGEGPSGLRRYLVLDLLVAQRLAFLENLADSQWRLILAYQDVTTEGVGDPGEGSPLDTTSTYSRLSGGVEIRF